MKYNFLLLVFCFSTIAYCQTTKSSSIVSFSEQLLLKINTNKQSESFLIGIPGNNAFIIEANNIYKIKLSANYKFLGLSVGFSPSNAKGDFKSKFRNIQLRLFIKQWFQTFEYRKVRGFFQNEINIENPLAQYPNLKTINWTGNTSYVFNSDFSLKHLLAQNEWQTESAGSFIPALTYGFNRLSNAVEGEKYIQNNFDIALSPSYYYTWIIENHWFISPTISPSIGVRFSKEKINATKTTNTFFTKSIDFRLQFGYTSEKISAGATFNFDSSTSKEALFLNSVNDKSYAGIYFGYRFNPPNFIKKTADWVEDKVGL